MARSFEKTQLTGKQKAALLLLSLDVETAAGVMKKFNQDELESVTLEIANVKGVSPKMIENVTDEFHQLIVPQQYVIQGGIDYAQKLLEQTLGFTRAS